MSNIATLDNDTMVGTFNFLNYCQLAKNSLVSKKFWDLIRTNRHRLALLYVDRITMKLIGWVKDHVSCDEIRIRNNRQSNYDEELLDLLVTGTQCTPEINLDYSISTKMVVEFVQKSMDLKTSDECQMVESVQGTIEGQEVIEVLKRDYAEFIVEEEMDQVFGNIERVFVFVNNDAGKKNYNPGAKTMRRSAELVEKQAESKNETQEEPKAKKDRSEERTSKTATLDNGTLVEVFKYLNYCGLAYNCLVSKRFWNIIRTNRYRLALLYVDRIWMRITLYTCYSSRARIKVFQKELSPKEYNEWVDRNNFSKQMPLEGQAAGIQRTHSSVDPYDRIDFELSAVAFYKESTTVEAKKMRGSTEKKDANLKTDAEEELKAKKGQSDNRISNIATLDNDTMVEVFKHLNYCQLAKKSLVSKRFRDLIQTHRQKLALLRVGRVFMSAFDANRYLINDRSPISIKVFNKQLSQANNFEAYNKWVAWNQYSKQIPRTLKTNSNKCNKWVVWNANRCKCQRKKKSERKAYELCADAFCKDQNCCSPSGSTSALLACAELNDENWPLFQHFVRLLTDPFIYIYYLEFTSQDDVLNLLAAAMNPYGSRIQCMQLSIELQDNGRKSIHCIKKHVRCDELLITVGRNCRHLRKELLYLFVTGAHCTSEICISNYELPDAVIKLVQKFLDFKTCGECRMVESIRGSVSDLVWEALKSNYAEFIVKEEESGDDVYSGNVQHCFQFINNDIGKKLQLTIRFFQKRHYDFVLSIKNL
ncbi:hypothetical protein DdX_15719 [Ditylenchus destructor]|uniref:F-box domain-containing protein n=1 Tax=Ditylenchus destructor TaxID=166010 RepID=A0AAD4QUH2_9BILA|nr:hypothetical protein DdX_15719 [Ditylenchus destructor]